jgi:hypothetical protein
MKLRDFAKQKGVTYRTAWNWYKAGLVSGQQIGRTIIVHEDQPSPSRVNLGSDFTPREFGAVHIGIGDAGADCPDQLREFSSGNPLTSLLFRDNRARSAK